MNFGCIKYYECFRHADFLWIFRILNNYKFSVYLNFYLEFKKNIKKKIGQNISNTNAIRGIKCDHKIISEYFIFKLIDSTPCFLHKKKSKLGVTRDLI